MAENVKGIMLFSEHLHGYELLTDSQLGCLVRALFANEGLGSMPEMDSVTQIVFALVAPATRQTIEKWQTNAKIHAEAGKKGGRPRKDEETKKPNGFSENQMVSDNGEEKPLGVNQIKSNQIKANQSKLKDGDSTPPPSKQRLKSPHGQFGTVMLTEEEHDKLVEQFGLKGAEDMITRLDEYIASKGVKYKSHYATILAWKRKDSEQPVRVQPSGRESLTEYNKAVAAQVCAELEAADAPF